MIGIMGASILSGQIISRTGRYKKFPIIGTGLLLLAMLGLSQVGTDTPVGATLALAFVFGIGLGFNMQPLVLAVQNAVPPQDMGVATSSATFFRQMGGTLGTAVFLSVLFSTVGDKITSSFRPRPAPPTSRPRSPTRSWRPTRSTARWSRRSRAAPGCRRAPSTTRRSCRSSTTGSPRPFLDGFSSAIDLVFLSAAGVLLIAFVIVFFLPEEKLRTMSGIQARQQQEADDAA